MNAEWKHDPKYDAWVLHAEGALIVIAPRPGHCDRGRYVVTVSGLGDIDHADGFPRYFMDLERAKQEMTDWIAWRLRTYTLTAWNAWNSRVTLVAEFVAVTGALIHWNMLDHADAQALRDMLVRMRGRVGERP